MESLQMLKLIQQNVASRYLSSPLDYQLMMTSSESTVDSTIETDNSSNSSHGQDFDWSSRRSSPAMKSGHSSEYDEDDEANEVLSVGCESPPPASLSSPVISSDSLKMKALSDSHKALKFGIDNILRPEFGDPKIQRTSASKKSSTTVDSPVDLSRECSEAKNTKTDESRVSSPTSENNNNKNKNNLNMWPAWVYCTRYSDRPSSGPRMRVKRKEKRPEEKRPRTAFTGEQLGRLKKEFNDNHYLTEKRRQELATELGLHEAQIKIWFQNKRAKIKKAKGTKNPLALKLMAEGLYNHSTLPMNSDEKDSL